jgi:hypothetical protein
MTSPISSSAENPSRATGVQDQSAGIWMKLVFWRVKRRYGHVPLATRIRALDPKLLALSERMNRYTLAAGIVSPKLKELVQLKVAVMVGCPF